MVFDDQLRALVPAQRGRGALQALRALLVMLTDVIDAPSSRSLYSTAAAEELIAERATALQRMRDAGVVVLDVAPDAMAAAVVNQYLELKARGAL